MNPKLNEILQEIEKVVVGKNEIIEKIMMAILAGGHVLMEILFAYPAVMARKATKNISLQMRNSLWVNGTAVRQLCWFPICLLVRSILTQNMIPLN